MNKKKIKKPSRRRLIKQLDKLASLVVRKRGVCEMKGENGLCGGPLQCAHLFSRRHYATRWNLDNLVALCIRHHLYVAHKDPLLFSDWVIKRLGFERYQNLKWQASQVAHWKTDELLGIRARLEAELK